MDKQPATSAQQNSPSRAEQRSLSAKSRRGYLWATLAFLAVSMVGHWYFGWLAHVHESEAHAQPVQVSEYLTDMARDTFENWQSEFLQLIWQVVGLAVFLYVGSPQSKEGHDRLEAKLDLLIDRSPGGPQARAEIDERFLREQ
jgi:hypothetical protein